MSVEAQAIQQFNEEKIAGRMSQKAKERLAQAGKPELLDENVNIIYEFCKIAVNLVKSELSTELDEKTAKNLVILFIKCLTQAIIKCDQHNIDGDIKVRSLQGLALDVYNLCKDYSITAMAQPADDPSMEEARTQIRKTTMQRLKFHIDQAKQG